MPGNENGTVRLVILGETGGTLRLGNYDCDDFRLSLHDVASAGGSETSNDDDGSGARAVARDPSGRDPACRFYWTEEQCEDYLSRRRGE